MVSIQITYHKLGSFYITYIDPHPLPVFSRVLPIVAIQRCVATNPLTLRTAQRSILAPGGCEKKNTTLLDVFENPVQSWDTPPKTNMEPEKDGFQKESPFPGVHFQVPC